jgi:hypothetical protein
MIDKIDHLLSVEGIEELRLWCAPANVTVINNINGEEPYVNSNDPTISVTKLTVEVQLEKELKRLVTEYVRVIDKQLFNFHIHLERLRYADYILKATNFALKKWSSLPCFSTYPIVSTYLEELKENVETRLKPIVEDKPVLSSSTSKATKGNSPVFTFKHFYFNKDKTNNLVTGLLSTGWIADRPFDQDTENSKQVRSDLNGVLSGKNLNRPVVWIGPKNQLYYLVTQLHQRKLLIGANEQNYWDMAINSFVNTNGAKYDKRSLQVTNPPASTEVIDSLLDNM